MEHLPLIQTKLYRPRITDVLVAQPRLFDWLYCNHSKPLNPASASARNGNSASLSSWLEQVDCPNACLSLNEQEKNICTLLV